MCVFRVCNLCADQANKHVQGFFIWVSYHDEHARALAARASTQICHGACGSCPCRSRPLRLCVPADPVPAPITWRLLLIITFKRILPMQLLHMRLRHPQQLLVHAPIATYYQYPRAIPVSAAPELQLYILLHFRRRGERGDGHIPRVVRSCGQHGRCDQGAQGRMSHMPHARALGGWDRERGEGARMDFFPLPIRKKGGRG